MASGKSINIKRIQAQGASYVETPMWDAFVNFLIERQRIWYKKSILKLPFPWTDDKVLQEAKIINVYRELDTNTKYEIENIVKGCADAPFKQILRLILFRHTNSPKLYEALIERTYTEEEFKGVYDKLHAEGHGVSRAMLFNTPRSMPYWQWVWKFHNHLNENGLSITGKVLQAKSAKELFDVFDDLPHIGEFFAYEMYTSATYYPWCPYTEDDFVVAGPGAIPGLEIILGLPWETLYYKEAVFLINHCAPLIRDRLIAHPEYIWIPTECQPKNPQKHKFTARTLEHTLCEARKYWNIVNGVSGIRRHYTPSVSLIQS